MGSNEVDTMRLSVIDIGTNTILMVTAEVESDGSIRVLDDHHEIARLGRGVDATRTIGPDTFDRVAGFLARYRTIAEGFGAERIVAFGTSALRDARNRDEFIAAMRERTGIGIEVVDGDQEAALTYRGAFFDLNVEASAEHRAVIDIGGGSTEIALGSSKGVDRAVSLDVGAVRLTERCFTALPPLIGELEHARVLVREALLTAIAIPRHTAVVGVAGTVTTLGAIDAGMERFDAAELNGRRLTSTTIKRLTAQLTTMTQQDVAALPQVPSERADVLLAGAVILEEFVHHYGVDAIIVSTRGVRYGVLEREIGRGHLENSVGFSSS